MATYLERYLAGEHEQVWRDIVALGDAVREEPAFTDAEALAREMMCRVRRNIERLIPRLRERGYVFADEEPLHAPDENAGAYIAELEQWGPLPLALRVFYEVVGDVTLEGAFPEGDVAFGKTDSPLSPLVVAGLLSNFDQWMAAYDEEEASVDLDVCYDPEHVLGAFTLRGPCWAADAYLLVEGEHPLRGALGEPLLFVDYLRVSLQWGGFPSLAPGPRSTVAELVEGFEPF